MMKGGNFRFAQMKGSALSVISLIQLKICVYGFALDQRVSQKTQQVQLAFAGMIDGN